MTADEYQAALKRWGMKHRAASEFFGFTVITSQRYATGEREVPTTLAMLIRLMMALKLTPETASEWIAEADPTGSIQ